MQEAIAQFRNRYADQFADGALAFIERDGQIIVRRIQGSLTNARSTVYLFGNGGSHAICQCFKYALHTYARERGLSLRVQTGVDVHCLTQHSTADHPGTSFVQILQAEGADANDLLILISGSGDSDNLCAAASYARLRGIATLALIGSAGGRLRQFVDPELCFCTPLEDQQVSEDTIQALAFFLHGVDSGASADWSKAVKSHTEKLRSAIKHIPVSFITGIADAVVQNFYRREATWVVGLDHPALSVCAEHTAHNFYWDGIYQVSKPPPRRIFSTPTACDFSGIFNDRRRGLLEILTGLEAADGAGAAIFYSMTLGHPGLSELLEHPGGYRLPTFLFCAEDRPARARRSLIIHQTGLTEPQLHASASQILGHLVGRVVRLKLLEREHTLGGPLAIDRASFLIDFDLAQRRLLDD